MWKRGRVIVWNKKTNKGDDRSYREEWEKQKARREESRIGRH